VSQYLNAAPAFPGVDSGLGIPPSKAIVSLPPLEAIPSALPIDPKTGEPQRHFVIALAYGLLLLAAACQSAGLGLAWWRAIDMKTFPTAIRLLEWTKPVAGSPASIFLAVAMTAIGVMLVAAPAITGYLGWVGRPAAGYWALAALGLAALTLLISPSPLKVNWANIGWLAIPLTALGCLLIWLPAAQKSLGYWQAWRQPQMTPPVERQPIRYGRLEQYQ